MRGCYLARRDNRQVHRGRRNAALQRPTPNRGRRSRRPGGPSRYRDARWLRATSRRLAQLGTAGGADLQPHRSRLRDRVRVDHWPPAVQADHRHRRGCHPSGKPMRAGQERRQRDPRRRRARRPGQEPIHPRARSEHAGNTRTAQAEVEACACRQRNLARVGSRVHPHAPWHRR